MSKQTRNLVILGDGAVGKTTLIIVFAKGHFPVHYTPTTIEHYALDFEVQGELLQLVLWDTSSRGEFEDRLRPLYYPGSHAFLICFSIGSPDSLEHALEKWGPEVKRFGVAEVPRFLVGCKKDLRNDQETLRELAQSSQVPVTTEQGEEIAKIIGATYVECSSKTGEGVRELFAQVTESMEAERVARHRYGAQRPWYRKAGCIVV